MSLNPYLYFNGQCEEALKFYEQCLGGKITFLMTWEGSLMANQAPPGWAKKILHAILTLDVGVLEGCDAMPGQYKNPQSFCLMFRPTRQSVSSVLLPRTARSRSPLWKLSGHCDSARSLIETGYPG